MKRSCKTFLCAFASAFVAAAAIYVAVVTYCGRGYCSQPWFLDFHPLKRHFAAQKASPKIILYGGSSSLYGISGEELRRYTGLDNVNLSTSALMPMRFYLVDLERFMGEGDVVVLPLELDYHHCESDAKVFSDFGISCLLGALPEAKRQLSARELISLYANYGFSWAVKTLFHPDGTLGRLQAGETKQGVFEGLHSEDYVADQWRRAAVGEIHKTGHPWEVSPYGDLMRDLPARFQDVPNPSVSNELTEEFLTTYRKIEALVKERHGTLLLVWPNQYCYVEQCGMEGLAKALREHGIRICGRPEATAFPKSLYFEPTHHMNRQGARLWTRELAKTICAETGRPFLGGNEAWPYVVFADDPETYLPGVIAETGETGVCVHTNAFPIVVRLPEDLRGRDLAVSIVMKPPMPGRASLKAISCDGANLEFEENCFSVRSECQILVPSNCTRSAVLKLPLVQAGDSLGLERLFVCASRRSAARCANGYSVARDTDLVLLGQGFSTMEEWGCWTDGERADLSLAVPRGFQGKAFRMTFDTLAFVTTGHEVCEIAVASGDVPLGDFSFREFDTSFSVTVPADCTKGRVLPLTIRVKNPVSHKDLGNGTDSRRLGVGLKRVRFEDSAK